MQKVKVYGSKGEVEVHTKANARDLVANCNGYWSWNPQKKSTAMDPPPFIRVTPPSNKPQSHEILERMGTGAVRDVEEVKPIETPEDNEDVIDAADPDNAGEPGVVTVEDTTPAEAPVDVVEDEPAAPAPAPVSDEKPRPRRKRFEG